MPDVTARRPHPDGDRRAVVHGGDDDGTSEADEALRALHGDAGVDDRDAIADCRIGERSAHTWFVRHELRDRPNAKNHDGSWTEYGSLVGVLTDKEAAPA